MPILEVQNLKVEFFHDGQYQPVVHSINYTLERGKVLGIVGESGSGKSVSTMALMGLLPRKTSRVSGSALFKGQDLLSLSEEQMQDIRGAKISMIFQEPMTALNPVKKCGKQVLEMLQLHEKVSCRQAKQRVIELFNEVLLPRPEKIFDSYPHELSGGQKQRVMIAMALICSPDIIIADEPTTALDVTVQKTILQLLRNLQQQRNISIIFITHDLGVIAQIADEVLVMYKGDIVESGTAADVLYHPRHRYTQGLLACRPPLDSRPLHLPTVSGFLEQKSSDISSVERASYVYADKETPLLSVRDWNVTYTLKRNFFGKPLQQLKGVDGVSFDIYPGETLGLVGESGCGKTTLGRSLLQLIKSSSGSVSYKGKCLNTLSAADLRHLRPEIQIIFQDPYSSLNPRIPIGEAIAEPLLVHKLCSDRQECRTKVLELMEQVGLSPEWYSRYPHEFSGGQRQRVCIARALITRPSLVVCDESVSALDVSVQAQVLNLLNDLKDRYGLTYLFITHNLSVAKFFSDRIMVMRRGAVVEINTADELYAHPQQSYTQSLIDAIPQL